VPQNPGVDASATHGQPGKATPLDAQVPFPFANLPLQRPVLQVGPDSEHPALSPSYPSSGSGVGHPEAVVVVSVAVTEQPVTLNELVVLQLVDVPSIKSHDTKKSVTVAVEHLELEAEVLVMVAGSTPSGKHSPIAQGMQIGSGGTTQGTSGGGGPVPGGKQSPVIQGIHIGRGGTTHGIR
jgi:hypothetical protein